MSEERTSRAGDELTFNHSSTVAPCSFKLHPFLQQGCSPSLLISASVRRKRLRTSALCALDLFLSSSVSDKRIRHDRSNRESKLILKDVSRALQEGSSNGPVSISKPAPSGAEEGLRLSQVYEDSQQHFKLDVPITFSRSGKMASGNAAQNGADASVPDRILAL